MYTTKTDVGSMYIRSILTWTGGQAQGMNYLLVDLRLIFEWRKSDRMSSCIDHFVYGELEWGYGSIPLLVQKCILIL